MRGLILLSIMCAGCKMNEQKVKYKNQICEYYVSTTDNLVVCPNGKRYMNATDLEAP